MEIGEFVKFVMLGFLIKDFFWNHLFLKAYLFNLKITISSSIYIFKKMAIIYYIRNLER